MRLWDNKKCTSSVVSSLCRLDECAAPLYYKDNTANPTGSIMIITNHIAHDAHDIAVTIAQTSSLAPQRKCHRRSKSEGDAPANDTAAIYTPPPQRHSLKHSTLLATHDRLLSDVAAQWSALVERERNTVYQIQNRHHHCHHHNERSEQRARDNNNRARLCEWYYSAVDHYSIDRRIVSFALDFFDRYVILSSYQGNTQLVGLTCLYMAIKIHSSCEKQLPLIVVARMMNPRPVGTIEDHCRMMEIMELRICKAFEWYLMPPVPALFMDVLHLVLDEYLKDQCHGGLKNSIKDLSQYLIELSVAHGKYFAGMRPSSVAFAAVLVAINLSALNNAMKRSSVIQLASANLHHELDRDQLGVCIGTFDQFAYQMYGGRGERLVSSPTSVGEVYGEG